MEVARVMSVSPRPFDEISQPNPFDEDTSPSGNTYGNFKYEEEETTSEVESHTESTYKKQNWMEILTAAKEEFKTAFNAAKFRGMNTSRSDERQDDNTPDDEREFHDAARDMAESDSMEAVNSSDDRQPTCSELPGRCAMDLPDKEDWKQELNSLRMACDPRPKETKIPPLEQKGDHIDFLFEFVESAICGHCDATRQQEESGLNAIDLNKLPTYKMLQAKGNDDESIYSAEGKSYSSRSHRSSSSRKKRSHAPSSKRRSRGSSSRSSKEEMAPMDELMEESKHLGTERSAKHISKSRTPIMKSSLKASSLKPNANSAFEDMSTCKAHASNNTVSTAVSSHVTDATQSDVGGLRELCVLSIGSGSAVSSFDPDNTSWPHQRKQLRGPLGTADVLKNLASFLGSLLGSLNAGQASVNKALYGIALMIAVLLWPAHKERERVHYEVKEEPKKVSLLKLVQG
eukprot:Nitzschia sp. Nitz4//scaffold16_size188269//35367//36743//NITZ4_001777-RA/size188269-processed-gene-0.44-mRNA-1//-1//CDS//3329538473//4332//frame0